MAVRVLFTSQKGGVGKSTLARSLAVAGAERGDRVLLADFDTEQLTCVGWQAQRVARELEPEIEVASFKRLKKLEAVEERYDLVVLDTRGLVDKQTMQLAKWVDAVVLPTGFSSDDLMPTMMLAEKLKSGGVPRQKLAVVFARGGRSERQEEDARATVRMNGVTALQAVLPWRDGYVNSLAAGRALRESANPYLREAAESVDAAMLRFMTRARRA